MEKAKYYSIRSLKWFQSVNRVVASIELELSLKEAKDEALKSDPYAFNPYQSAISCFVSEKYQNNAYHQELKRYQQQFGSDKWESEPFQYTEEDRNELLTYLTRMIEILKEDLLDYYGLKLDYSLHFSIA